MPISGSLSKHSTPSNPGNRSVRRLLPEPADLAAEEIYGDLRFPEAPEHRPYAAINMVSTIDGKITIGGNAGGIGGPVDRLAMRLLRSSVDAVMVGAGTVRAEKINLGLPQDLRAMISNPSPLGIVISAGGDVPLDNLIQNEGERLLFLISEHATHGAEKTLASRGEVLRMPDTLGYEAALSMLRDEYEVGRLLVEGGPSLNRALIEARMVDELFLTFAPKLAAGEAPNILSGAELETPSGARLVSAYESGGELYLRYSLGHDRA